MISVIIPTFRGRGYIYDAIESVRRQTQSAYEIIVVVDGADKEAINELNAQNPDIILIEQPNRGVALARNTGIAFASGDWVAFLDDDDLWHPNFLEKLAGYVESRPECKAIRCGVWFFKSPTEKHSKVGTIDFHADTLDECCRWVEEDGMARSNNGYLFIEGESFERMRERFLGCMMTTAVERTTLIRAGGFPPMQACGEDWTMHVNVARLTEWHTLPERLGFSRSHGANNTHNPDNAVSMLAGYVNAWLGGRPSKEKINLSTAMKELGSYGKFYRYLIQRSLWTSLRKGELRKAIRFVHFAGLLLPRWRDWAFAMVPPQITWRWQKYITKKFD